MSKSYSTIIGSSVVADNPLTRHHAPPQPSDDSGMSTAIRNNNPETIDSNVLTAQPMGRRDLLLRLALAVAGAAALPSCATALPPLRTLLSSSTKRDSSDQLLDFNEYRRHDAVSLAAMVRRGEVTPLTLLEIAIARAEEVDAALNFMTVPLYDRARKVLAKHTPTGPLGGIPFLLKDLSVDLQGTITTRGSRLFRDSVATQTSTVVHRYQDAGLVIFGKTASPEFGGSVTTEPILHGPTRNPWNHNLSTGGSSGGSAVAVATGVVPVAHGTDGGGSIRIPASACGLFGLKPSRGRLPTGPAHMEFTAGFSTSHVLSRTVRDSAALLDATHGSEPGATYHITPPPRSYLAETRRAPGRLRIAVVRAPPYPMELHRDCEDALEDAITLCSKLRHRLVETRMPNGRLEDIMIGFGVVNSSHWATVFQSHENRFGKVANPSRLLEDITWNSIVGGRRITATYYLNALASLRQFGRRLAQHFSDFDVILGPTLGLPPAKIGTIGKQKTQDELLHAVLPYAAFTNLYNISGQPAMSVPLYWNAQQVPIGVMFAAHMNDESTLFRLAGQLERERPWAHHYPPDWS